MSWLSDDEEPGTSEIIPFSSVKFQWVVVNAITGIVFLTCISPLVTLLESSCFAWFLLVMGAANVCFAVNVQRQKRTESRRETYWWARGRDFHARLYARKRESSSSDSDVPLKRKQSRSHGSSRNHEVYEEEHGEYRGRENHVQRKSSQRHGSSHNRHDSRRREFSATRLFPQSRG